MISVAGKLEVIVCDQCALPCTGEVIARTHWHIGQEDRAVTEHFCSAACENDFKKVTEQIVQGIEQGLKLELGKIYKHGVCPRCLSRLRRIFEEEETVL